MKIPFTIWGWQMHYSNSEVQFALQEQLAQK